MPPKNQAVWIPAKGVATLQVKDAPYTAPGPGQMVIQTAAIGINPFDWVLQHQGGLFASHVQYPFILGSDISGTVVELGPAITRFKVGDRVAGSAASIAKESNQASEGAFQLYVVVREYLIPKIPDHVSHEAAAALGLGITTAVFGLFHKDYLALDAPLVPPPKNPRDGETYPRAVIITGGASNVGTCAIQLAVSAGYQVISTSSPRNFDYVRSLGAEHVFDYRSETLAADLVRVLEGKNFVGAFTIGANADAICATVIKERKSRTPTLPTRPFVALAGGSQRDPESIHGFLGSLRLMTGFMSMMVRNMVRKWFTGVETKFILLAGVVNPSSCVSDVYMNFLGEALAAGQFIPGPAPQVVGKGLECVNEALDVNKKGVSGKKIVVCLP